MSASLEIVGVSKRLGGSAILRDVSLSVRPGERLALVGPNGAGKSTLFNLVSGQFAPDAGQVHLDGRSIGGRSPQAIHRLGLARSFQITQLFHRLSVLDNLRCASLAALGHGIHPFRLLSRQTAVHARALEMAERLGLAARMQVPAGELSYAEQRALEMGLALAGAPRMLLLDEPTAGMSRSETKQAVRLIRELTQGCTLLLVEHDMGVVFELADRVAVLHQGQVIACDAPEAIRADPRVREAYLGQAMAGQGAC